MKAVLNASAVRYNDEPQRSLPPSMQAASRVLTLRVLCLKAFINGLSFRLHLTINPAPHEHLKKL